MTIENFDHFTIRAADFDASKRFYEEALGLRYQERPGFAVAAALLFVGNEPLVNLFQASPEQEAAFAQQKDDGQWRTGRFHHVAFWATGLPQFRERLAQKGVAGRERTLTDKHQIIVKDPDGVEIEINFSLAEAGAAG